MAKRSSEAFRRAFSIPALETLKVRSEFLAVRGGSRASVPACLIETRKRRAALAGSKKPMPEGVADGPRFGFTVTKKLGSAVTRNRIRRRLKAAIAQLAGAHAKDGHDYVVVARAAALDRPFEDILSDLTRAFKILHSGGDAKALQRAKNPAGKSPP